MKKTLTLLLLTLTLSTSVFSQDSVTVSVETLTELKSQIAESVQDVEPIISYVDTTLMKNATTLEKAIAPYVQKALSGLESGTNVLIEEVPIVIKQYLMFESARHGIKLLFGILLLSLTWIISKRICTSRNEDQYTYSTKIGKRFIKSSSDFPTLQWFGIIFLNLGGHILGLVLFTHSLFPFIKVAFMPKLYLLEKFIHMF